VLWLLVVEVDPLQLDSEESVLVELVWVWLELLTVELVDRVELLFVERVEAERLWVMLVEVVRLLELVELVTVEPLLSLWLVVVDVLLELELLELVLLLEDSLWVEVVELLLAELVELVWLWVEQELVLALLELVSSTETITGSGGSQGVTPSPELNLRIAGLLSTPSRRSISWSSQSRLSSISKEISVAVEARVLSARRSGGWLPTSESITRRLESPTAGPR
jgi:hypothetical protein